MAQIPNPFLLKSKRVFKEAENIERESVSKEAEKIERESVSKDAEEIERESVCKEAEKIERESVCKGAEKIERESVTKEAEKIEKESVCKGAERSKSDILGAQIIEEIIKDAGITDYEDEVTDHLLESMKKYGRSIIDNVPTYAKQNKIIDGPDVDFAVKKLSKKEASTTNERRHAKISIQRLNNGIRMNCNPGMSLLGNRSQRKSIPTESKNNVPEMKPKPEMFMLPHHSSRFFGHPCCYDLKYNSQEK